MTINRSEKEIIEALKDGDESAFRVIFDLHFKRLYTFCFRLLKNREQAEEVVNDTLMNVWQNRHKLNADFPVLPYLYTITRRLALNMLRDMATSKRAIDQLWINMEKMSNTTEDSVLLNDLQRFTDEALVNLPPQQQLVFKMSRFEGLNFDEIAGKLNISRNTVKNHLVAALKTLKLHFNHTDVGYFLLISVSLLKK